jgi:hypothetical protein
MAGVLENTSSATVFRPGLEGDPAGVLYTVGLNGVSTDCSFDKRGGKTDSTLTLYFRATRAPNGAAASHSVRYYVAVTQGSRILSKREFVVQFTFAPGAAVARFKDHVESTKLQLQSGKRPYDYQILAGLQLSKSQRAYAEKMGYFAQ